MEKEPILAAIDHAFGHLPRPEIMLREPTHCDECIEHEATMQAVTPGTISLTKSVSRWDRVCFIADDTYAYFMPAFRAPGLDDSIITPICISYFSTSAIRVASLPSTPTNAKPSPNSWITSAKTYSM